MVSCQALAVNNDASLRHLHALFYRRELKGEEVIAEMIVECRTKYGVKHGDDLPPTNVEC